MAPKPVSIFIAKDPLLAERALAALRDESVPPEARAFNFDVLEGGKTNANAILAAASTLPMMAQRRMVVVRDLSALPAAELARLIPYLEDPNPTTVLACFASKADGRLKFYSTAKKRGFLVDLSPPRRLGPWLQGELRELAIDMSGPAQRRLIELVGADLSRLSLTSTQLALYTGGRRIEVDDVDDLVAETRERSVFELTDAIGSGDRNRALAAIASLCDSRQSAIGVVMMLARHVRQIALVHRARSRGVPPRAMAKEVGVPPFVVDKLLSQAERLPPAAIPGALARLAWADRELKGYGQRVKVLGRALAERLILEDLALALLSPDARRSA